MFKDSDNVSFYRDQNEGREMFHGNKKTFETNNNNHSRTKLYLSPQPFQPKNTQRTHSPFTGKLVTNQNKEFLSNLIGQTSPKSPLKLPPTPSKLKMLIQNPKCVLTQNFQGSVQFRAKSPTNKVNQYKSNVNQEPTNLINGGLKLLNFNTKRGSLQYPSQTFFQSQDEDKKPKAQLLNDIIKNCGKKQQQIQSNNSNFQLRAKSPFLKQHKKVKTLNNQQVIPFPMCSNNHGKQAKYRLLTDQQFSSYFYCPKCAIGLIQQGFQVVELQHQYQIKQQQHLNPDALNIIQKLTYLSGQLINKCQQAQYYRSEHINLYSNQLLLADQYYNSLINEIEQLRLKDRQIIIEYQNNDLKDLNEFIAKLNECIEEIKVVKVQIHNKPEMLDLMKNVFEEHINMYEEILTCDVKPKDKKISIAQLGNRVQDFKDMLTQSFPLTIEEFQISQDQKMKCSQGIAFSFEGTLLQEQQKNKNGAFRELFNSEQHPETYEATQEIVGTTNIQNQTYDGSCSPSFKKI